MYLSTSYFGRLHGSNTAVEFARDLLYGLQSNRWYGRPPYEPVRDVYFKQNILWAQIADLTVQDVKMNCRRYTLTYSDGTTLEVEVEKGRYVLTKRAFATTASRQ